MVTVLHVSQAQLFVESGTPPPPAEIALLTRALHRGDESAYTEFFNRYFHRLLAYLLVLTRGNDSLARDLLQQTMIKVARHVRPFDDELQFWRWLTVLARTAAWDDQKKTRRHLTFLQRFWDSRPAHPPLSDPAVSFSEILRASLELTDPNDRALLERKYLDGASVDELAGELALSPKAVESRLTRARTRLREKLLEVLRHE